VEKLNQIQEKKVRLCSVMGERVDILPHFIKHYKKLGVNEFHIIVHVPFQNHPFYQIATKALKKERLKAHSFYFGSCNGKICTQLLNNIKKHYPNDWFLIADQDEFQLYPKEIRKIIKDCERDNKNFVTGCFLDRVSDNGKLLELKENVSIWKQFPICGFLSFPLCEANPYKITLCKGKILLSEGQHSVDTGGQYPVTNELVSQVHHFKWTKCFKERFQKRLEKFELGDWEGSYLGYSVEVKKTLKYFIFNDNKINIYEPIFLMSKSDEYFKSYFFWNKINKIVETWESLQKYPKINTNLQKIKNKRKNFLNTVDVSIIISSYNQNNTIKKTLNFISKEALAKNYKIQVIVADDGSKTKNCLDLMQNFSKYKNNSNLILNFVWQQDQGFRLAKSRNNGLLLAESKNIIFIDGDCIPNFNFIEEHLKIINSEYNVCVGSRSYRPSLESSQITSNEYKKFRLKEKMENYTINTKIKSSMSWRSVIGRNFSFSQTNPPVYFDERIVGWGFEDNDFALQLFIKDNKNITFNIKANVIQYDNLDNCNDLFININQQKIAYTQANGLLLMFKYKKYPKIFKELSKYLKYYTEPFDFDGKEYIINLKKKDEFLKEFSQDKSAKIHEAIQIYESCFKNLQSFFKRNLYIQKHPAMKSLENNNVAKSKEIIGIWTGAVLQKLSSKQNTKKEKKVINY